VINPVVEPVETTLLWKLKKTPSQQGGVFYFIPLSLRDDLAAWRVVAIRQNVRRGSRVMGWKAFYIGIFYRF
jgi:hypothetical protein